MTFPGSYDLPMISSLLDNDFYQFAMSNAVWMNGDGGLPVRYEFRNRTFQVPLAARIDPELLGALTDRVRELRFETDEIDYLRNLGYFNADWLDALDSFRLPPVEIGEENGHLTVNYEGPWAEAIFWETPLLSLVNECYFKRFGTQPADEGSLRLTEKIEYLRQRKTIRFVEFGSRRRYSSAWQAVVLDRLRLDVPDLLVGTSNVQLAREFGIAPVGTMAHQLFMVYTALFHEFPWKLDPFVAAQDRVLTIWNATYGQHPQMMTALTDTYSTAQFIQSCRPDTIAPFNGFRQDSGDPLEIGERLFEFAQLLGNERPRLIFSDGLNVRRMSLIDDRFGDRANVVYGWGTDLTNDLGFEPLSIVIKPCAVRSNDKWLPCVKLSDQREKATGDPVTIQQYLQELKHEI